MDVNATIRKAYNKSQNKGTFDVDLVALGATRSPEKTPPCFFLSDELYKTKQELYRTGKYRHCKVYKDGYLDYVVRKDFPTLEAWVADCGSSMDNILFGYQKFNGHQSYITLHQLLSQFEHVPLPVDNELDAFMNKLTLDELGLRDLLVVTPMAIQTYQHYMDL